MADYDYRRSINDFTISLNICIFMFCCVFLLSVYYLCMCMSALVILTMTNSYY